MADFPRVHGSPATGGFYGLQGRLIVIAATGKFTADSVDSTTKVITPGGYSGAVKAVEQSGSIVWLGAQTNNSFACIVDSGNFDDGYGDITESQYGNLIDNLVNECGGSAGNYTVTGYTVLQGDGTWA
jgi:hypothetical protein